MDGLELACFEIISKAGTAKSYCFEALKLAKQKRFDDAKQKIVEAKVIFLEAHTVHGTLITKEAQGNETKITLLLLHAEDQLMSAETSKDLIIEMITLYETFNETNR